MIDKGILGRMKEIWNMWQLICFFKKNRFSLAIKLIDKKASLKINDIIYKEAAEKKKKQETALGRALEKEERFEIYKTTREENVEYGEYLAYKEASSYHKEATIDRNDLVTLYLSIYFKELIEQKKNQAFRERIADKELHQKKIEINSVLESCIDPINGFVQKDPENNAYLCLTGKGKKFASLDGLIKEEIVNGVGVLWSAAAAAILGAGIGFAAKNSWDLVIGVWNLIHK